MAEFAQKRKLLIEKIKSMEITDHNVLDAIDKVHRNLFVQQDLEYEAYANYPLPIPGEQTISQPYTVAFMLQHLELKKGHKVLEIGTGSGWNAALIAELVGKNGKIITTEFVHDLISFAKQNIEKTHYKNIKIIETDGSQGHKPEAPYDRIIATAACPKIPKPWLEQLKNNGIIIAPVGSMYGQEMIKLVKKDHKTLEQSLGSFVFVPLIGKYGFKE